jgi:hypothetical protein
LANLSVRCREGTRQRPPQKAGEKLCRISNLHSAESPRSSCQEHSGLAKRDRLFHWIAVVSQNGFQLSTLAMSDRLFALRLLARVARKGSFSVAGRELDIPQSTASRMIATLEREVGVALFVRTTRAVTLIDAGLDFLTRIESVLAGLDEAEHAARGTGELRGILRIGLATTLAVREARAFVDYLMAALHEIAPPPPGPSSIGDKPRPSA